MTKLHIFRAGRHTTASGKSLEFTEAEVAAIAAAYDPAVHEAPIVVGHPKTDAPAYGWVRGLDAEGAELFAEPDQVEPEFAEMVRAGRFKRISASFYGPKSPANPTPGTYYLKHVGFLGAQPPSVKGLKAAEFAEEDDQAVTLEIDFSEATRAAGYGMAGVRRILSGMRDWMLASQGQEVADRVIPDYELEGLRGVESELRHTSGNDPDPVASYAAPEDTSLTDKETDDMSGQDAKTPEDIQRALDARAAELDAREAAFAESQRETRIQEDAELLDRLAEEGRIAPGLKAEVAAFMECLDADPADAISFAEGAPDETPRDWFRKLLDAQAKPLIDFSERAGGETAPQIETHQDITAAANRRIADAKAQGQTLSFAEAVRDVADTMEADHG